MTECAKTSLEADCLVEVPFRDLDTTQPASCRHKHAVPADQNSSAVCCVPAPPSSRCSQRLGKGGMHADLDGKIPCGRHIRNRSVRDHL